MTFCFPSAPLQLVLKDVVVFLLFWNSAAPTIAHIPVLYDSQYVYIQGGFVFRRIPTRCLIQATQQGSEMNIIGQRLFPFGGFVHNMKRITENDHDFISQLYVYALQLIHRYQYGGLST